MGGIGTRIGIETWHYQVSNLADPTKLEVKPFYRKIFTLLKKKKDRNQTILYFTQMTMGYCIGHTPLATDPTRN